MQLKVQEISNYQKVVNITPIYNVKSQKGCSGHIDFTTIYRADKKMTLKNILVPYSIEKSAKNEFSVKDPLLNKGLFVKGLILEFEARFNKKAKNQLNVGFVKSIQGKITKYKLQ